MIIWRGWGFLAAVILFGGLVIAQLVVTAIGGDGAYQANALLFGGVGLAAGGAGTRALGRWLDERNPPRRLRDEVTGREVIVHTYHDLFFIPMRIWGIIGMAGGVLMVLLGILGVRVS